MISMKEFVNYVLIQEGVSLYKVRHPDYRQFSCPTLNYLAGSKGFNQVWVLDIIALYCKEYYPDLDSYLYTIFVDEIAYRTGDRQSEVRKLWLEWLDKYCECQIQKYSDKKPLRAALVRWYLKR